MGSIERIEADGAASPSFAASTLAVQALAKQMLEPERYEHSVRVSQTAETLFPAYGLDPEAGRLAGMAHDLCKNLPREQRRLLAAAYSTEFGTAVPDELVADKRLTHGPAASVWLYRAGLVNDPEILDAIAFHTLGKPGMSRLALALYAADKLEPGRSHWRDGLRDDLARGLFAGHGGLERLVAALAEATVAYVRSQGWPVAPGTLILYNALTGKSL